MRKAIKGLVVVITFLIFCSSVFGNQIPVADAGSSRYAGTDPVQLDGTGSYDPDPGDILSYAWTQTEGPTVTITNGDTSTPTISGFTQTASIQECEFKLLVSDEELAGMPDTVKMIIVPDFNSGTILYSSELMQINPPFDPNKPTLFGFGGGNCTTGEGMNISMTYLSFHWYENVNFITVYSPDPRDSGRFQDYDPPYNRYGDMLIVYLSSVAPDYKQPIQIIGFSTGNNPTMAVAKYLNMSYEDPRYAINRVTLLDAGCGNFPLSDVASYLANPVNGEQCWIDDYYNPDAWSVLSTLNVHLPDTDHVGVLLWYDRSFYGESTLFETDVYNHGVVAGGYLSVAGPGKNFQLAPGNINYYYKWIGDFYPGPSPSGYPYVGTGYLDFYDESSCPGRLPEPVTLIGPADGTVVDGNGVVLTCEVSENAVGYQLLFGYDAEHVKYVFSDTLLPPDAVISKFPFAETWWTVRAYDAFGSTIHADPRYINAENVTIGPVENVNTGKTYPCIQLAIDDAREDDEIEVDQGTYHENIYFGRKNVVVRSTSPDDMSVVAGTVIEGTGMGSVVTFASSEGASCSLSGFTITGGNGQGGGGIRGNGTGAGAYIIKCIVTGNSAAGEGGGIKGVNGTISDCLIYGNSAADGGGIADCEGQIFNCLISGNTASKRGGGMYNENSSPTVTNCTFTGNSADYFGGGMYNYADSPTVTNCTFSGNSAGVRGGGMYNIFSSPIVTNCTFSGNSAGYFGGGMYNSGSSSNPTVSNCTFSSNSAGRDGGGMYNYADSPTVSNCILWDNTATSDGNEIYNYPDISHPANPLISYCDIAGSGGSISWDPNLGSDANGNIDADPCFVAAGSWDSNGTPADTNDDFWIDGDYRLLPQSLCINAGDPNYILDPNCPNDLDGNPRIVDGRIDMGAYEFPGMLGAKLFCVPRVLNTQNRRRTIVALLAMPEGILRSDINQSVSLVFTPGNVIAQRQYVFQWKKHGKPCTWVMAVFNKSDCMPHLSPGQNQVEVTGKLNDGRYFFGNCNLRVNSPTPTRNRHRRR